MLLCLNQNRIPARPIRYLDRLVLKLLQKSISLHATGGTEFDLI